MATIALYAGKMNRMPSLIGEVRKIQCAIKISRRMYDIIVSNPNNDINYGKRTIKNIVQYLEMELANDTMEYEELVSEVARQYKSMFPPRGGLSEFYIWDNNYEVRYQANHEYEQIKLQIEAILSKCK